MEIGEDKHNKCARKSNFIGGDEGQGGYDWSIREIMMQARPDRYSFCQYPENFAIFALISVGNYVTKSKNDESNYA